MICERIPERFFHFIIWETKNVFFTVGVVIFDGKVTCLIQQRHEVIVKMRYVD